MYWDALNKRNKTNAQRTNILQQIEFVRQKFGVTFGDLISNRRESSNARQALMFCLYYHCNMSYNQIGAFMGKDHSTVMYAVKKLKAA